MESQVTVSYQEALATEDTMRAVMYTEGFEDHEINTDPHYNLIAVTEDMWNNFNVRKSNRLDDNNLLFRNVKNEHGDVLPLRQNWNEVTSRLTALQPLFQIKGLFVAGGSIFSILFGEKINDIDCFLYGITDEEEAWATVQQFTDLTIGFNNSYSNASCLRTKNSISVNITTKYGSGINAGYRASNRTEVYQLILRLYRTPSEIIHGFDVDCCCMGYDGEHIWMTQRCLAALMAGYNTVNFDRLSPSYERRLAKYGARGISVKIPNFNRKNIDYEKVIDFANKYEHDNNRGNQHYAIRARKLQGLAILIYADHGMRLYRKACTSLFNTLCQENSDYANLGKVMHHGYPSSSIADFMDHMLKTTKKYPEASARYVPLMEKFLKPISEPEPEPVGEGSGEGDNDESDNDNEGICPSSYFGDGVHRIVPIMLSKNPANPDLHNTPLVCADCGASVRSCGHIAPTQAGEGIVLPPHTLIPPSTLAALGGYSPITPGTGRPTFTPVPPCPSSPTPTRSSPSHPAPPCPSSPTPTPPTTTPNSTTPLRIVTVPARPVDRPKIPREPFWKSEARSLASSIDLSKCLINNAVRDNKRDHFETLIDNLKVKCEAILDHQE